MKINCGTYCRRCVDDEGKLQEFEERFEKTVQWAMRQDHELSREEAEEKAKSYMRTMPTRRNHPEFMEIKTEGLNPPPQKIRKKHRLFLTFFINLHKLRH